MKKQLIRLGLLLSIVVTLPYSGFAEERYRDLLFADVEVVAGVQFGVGRRAEGADQPLLMDIYMPAGDTATDRAVVVPVSYTHLTLPTKA